LLNCRQIAGYSQISWLKNAILPETVKILASLVVGVELMFG
jgi:hypothetical protein